MNPPGSLGLPFPIYFANEGMSEKAPFLIWNNQASQTLIDINALGGERDKEGREHDSACHHHKTGIA